MTISGAVGRASGACGLAACGLARCGVIPLDTPPITTTPDVRVYNASMAWIFQTNLYTSFNPVINFYDVHTFSLVINQNVIDHTLFQPGGFLSYQTPDMPDPYLFIIDAKNLVVSPDGKGSDKMQITGRGVKCCLDFRKHMEEFSAGTGYDVQTGVAYETAMRHYITQEIISPTDAAREIPGITFAAVDGTRGGTVADIQKRTESVLDTIIELSKTSALGIDFVWTGTGLNFEIVFYEGTDRYTVGDPDCVTLSVDFRNVKGYSYNEDTTQMKNVAYVGGTGNAAARTLSEVYNGTEPTGWARRETFLDASDCATTNQRVEKGQALLVDSAEDTSLTFEYNPVSQSFIFGRDFTLGDIVNIVFPGVATVTSRIISASWTYDANGVKVRMEAGKKKPDWIGIVKHAILKAGIGGKR